MHKIAFYPFDKNRHNTLSKNNYISKFKEHLAEYFYIYEWQNYLGILNFFLEKDKYEILILNWIEDLPHKRFGILQTIILLFLWPIINKKIVLVIHNNISHSTKYFLIKLIILKYFLKRANLILTHSSEGINLINLIFSRDRKHICFLHHPLENIDYLSRNLVKDNFILQNDILIWGSIQRYKGVDNFLKYLYDNGLESKYRILIYGKAESKKLKKEITSYLNSNIRYLDNYLEKESLAKFIGISKIIFFPYKIRSILSSGILMDSIKFSNKILGPNTGAFKDLAKRNMINVYENFQDAIKKIDFLLSTTLDTTQINNRKKFIKIHTWENSLKYLADEIEKTV